MDRERTSSFRLQIQAEDRGSPTKISNPPFSLTVNILDENDNTPVFSPSNYAADVPENTTVGATIGEFNVSDADTGRNGQFDVTIIEVSAREMFEYKKNTGDLILRKNLDFEKKESYSFTIVAKDRGSPSLEKASSVSASLL